MKLLLYNTPSGLKPCYDKDFEEKKKLKIGEYYTADIKVVRNLQFHKKFFALLNLAFSLLPEQTQSGFRGVDGFRQYVTVAAGFYDTFYSPRLSEFVEIPKSISFSSMGECEFSELYERVKDVIFTILGNRISEEEFERLLIDF